MRLTSEATLPQGRKGGRKLYLREAVNMSRVNIQALQIQIWTCVELFLTAKCRKASANCAEAIVSRRMLT